MDDDLKKLMAICYQDAMEIAFKNATATTIMAVALFKERVKRKNPSHR